MTTPTTRAARVGAAMREAFSDFSVLVGNGQTVLTGELPDQAALYTVFERLQALGVEIVEVTTAEI
jgi:hypothetical protein